MDQKLEAVCKMQRYILAHIREPISLRDLSSVSCFSLWYSRRIFLEYLGVTPAEFVRKTKLKMAALELRDNKVKIIEVASNWGFESVDGFTRAFYKEYGCNPKEYALSPVPIPLFISYDIVTQYPRKEKKEMKNQPVHLSLVNKPARKVIVKRGVQATEYWTYCQEVGCDVWGILASIKSISGEPVCLWLPESYVKEGTSVYVQGAEVPLDYSGPIPEGFDLIELPACKYLMFQGEPFEEEDYEAAIQEVWKAEKDCDPSLFGVEFDPSNPRIQLEPIGKRGYIEFMPVR